MKLAHATDMTISLLIIVGWLGTIWGLAFEESSPFIMQDGKWISCSQLFSAELEMIAIYLHFSGCVVALTLGPILQIIDQVFGIRVRSKHTDYFGSLAMLVSSIICAIFIRMHRYESTLPTPLKLYEILVGLSTLMTLFEKTENGAPMDTDAPARAFCLVYFALLYHVLSVLFSATTSHVFGVFITYDWMLMVIVLLASGLTKRLLDYMGIKNE